MEVLSANMLILVFLSLVVATSRGSIVSTQYHSQDGHGGYSYGHSGGPSSRTESRTSGGVVTGSYSYLDGSGIIQTATYTADPTNGFKVHASNLPVPPPAPVYLPYIYHSAVPYDRPLGIPVVDTPEVAAAKVAHLAAVEHQKIIIASHPYRKRREVSYPGFSYHSSSTHVPVYYHPYIIHYPYLLASKISDDLPEPVTDTPEVAAAKSAHLSAVEHAKSSLGIH